MTKYVDFAEGLTPKGRVGAGAASKLLANADGRRSEIRFAVVDKGTVWFALAATAALNEGLPVTSEDGIQTLRGYEGDLSMITEAEGANEKQTITISNATGGTFTLSFGGNTTEALQAGVNEVQTVTLTGATGGTFTLKFGAKTTEGIAFDATAEKVKEELEALESVGAGNVEVSGEAGGPYTVTFIGELAAEDVAELEADGAELEGGEAEVTVETTTAGKAWVTKEEVEAALEGLESIGAGNVSVEGEDGEYTVEFVEELKQTDVDLIEIDSAELEGESVTATVAVETPGGVSVVFWEW